MKKILFGLTVGLFVMLSGTASATTPTIKVEGHSFPTGNTTEYLVNCHFVVESFGHPVGTISLKFEGIEPNTGSILVTDDFPLGEYTKKEYLLAPEGLPGDTGFHVRLTIGERSRTFWVKCGTGSEQSFPTTTTVPKPTTTTVPQTTTTTVVPLVTTTTVAPTTTTTVPLVEVQSAVQEELPKTGMETTHWIALGITLVALGFLVKRVA